MKEKDFLERHRNSADLVRDRILYEQYVSPDTAEMLIEGGGRFPENNTIEDLTVLFADITSFTRLVQRVDLKFLADFLKEFFELFTSTVYQNGGAIDKFMGDGALAIFGAPIALDDPADRALTSGLLLLKQFQPLCGKYQRKAAEFERINLGIGISSSEMFIGNLGSDRRFDYTVIGAGVNAAQRLASLSGGGTVLFTDDVLKRLAEPIEISKTEQVLLKGFDEHVSVHHCL